MRWGIGQLLNGREDMEVCGEAGDRASALAGIAATQPTLVLVDLSLGATSGLEVLKDLRAQYPAVLALIFTTYDDPDHAARCLRAGARGYVHKQEPVVSLVTAIHTVLTGGRYISPAVAGKLTDVWLAGPAADLSPLAQFTDREREVFRLLQRGCTPGHIAVALNTAVSTVYSHLEHMRVKAGVHDTHELTVYALRHSAAWLFLCGLS
ncbi:MAG: Oxygen regulatory protein NreC [Verrucomicrobiae bacterium]|nr:Oxygen regulatory protein NreC [Verrucomicrobiae bacterium]